MKIFLLILLSGLFLHDVTEVRRLYTLATTDEEKANELVEYTKLHSSENIVILGYMGAAEILLAKYAFSPISKWNYFNRGKKILESAIIKDPNNLELRFLRLTIQENIPAILGYSSLIENDMKFLYNKVGFTQDVQLQKMIMDYLGHKK